MSVCLWVCADICDGVDGGSGNGLSRGKRGSSMSIYIYTHNLGYVYVRALDDANAIHSILICEIIL